MTELQFGLLGLGAVAVIGVAVYNTWQEYKHRKLAQQVLDIPHEDVLLTPADSVGASEFQAPPGQGDNDFEPRVSPGVAEYTPEAPAMSERPAMLPPGMRSERIEPVIRFDDVPLEYQVSAPEPTPAFEAEAEPEPELEAGPKVFTPPVAQHIPEFVPEPAPSFVDTTAATVAATAATAAAAALAPRVDEIKESRESVEPLHLLSPVIDYVAAFDAVEPAPAYQILESQRDALARIRKPVHWIGYNEFGREWEPIIDDGRSEYRRIRVGLQTVDRRGPLADSDLSIFHIAMQDLADELMAIADMPPRQSALETAASLDQFCASVDIQIGINVISSGQVFPGTKLRALAEAAGMVIDDEGRFVRCDDDGNVLYVLINQEAAGFSVETMKTMSTHGITFLLDVPRVSHGERVFNQMVDLARRFADVLRGVLVDDNRRPLSEGALEPIRRQVGQYQSMMAARNLPAGGALAQRLFS